MLSPHCTNMESVFCSSLLTPINHVPAFARHDRVYSAFHCLRGFDGDRATHSLARPMVVSGGVRDRAGVDPDLLAAVPDVASAVSAGQCADRSRGVRDLGGAGYSLRLPRFVAVLQIDHGRGEKLAPAALEAEHRVHGATFDFEPGSGSGARGAVLAGLDDALAHRQGFPEGSFRYLSIFGLLDRGAALRLGAR